MITNYESSRIKPTIQYCDHGGVNVIMWSVTYRKPSISDRHYVTAGRWAQN